MSKRFYKKVEVKSDPPGFVVTLDDRVLKTPGKKPLIINPEFRADIVAAEWRAQGDQIVPQTMPCTRLLNVALELTPTRKPELIQEFLSYLGTDLLCYRTVNPADLAKRQEKNWQPVLDWAASVLGIALSTTTGLTALTPNPASLNIAQAYGENLDDIDLTLLLHFTGSLGSAILAIAVMEGHIDIRHAFALSRLDEIYQSELWGEDKDATKRANDIEAELVAIAKLIKENP